jgi:hypothetical protein
MSPDDGLSELYKDVFLFHWKEESQHAILDELEWKREDARLTPAQRDAAVGQFIGLVAAVDGILQLQSGADAEYFVSAITWRLTPDQASQVRRCLLDAYRWQYIVSGAQDPRFNEALGALITPTQAQRIQAALATLSP